MKRSHSSEQKRSQQHHMSTNTSRDKRMKKKKKKHKSSEDELRHNLHRRKDGATSAEVLTYVTHFYSNLNLI